MVEEQPANVNSDDQPEDASTPEPERLSQAARRERLTALSARIGDHAQQDGDLVIVEVGEPVVLHVELDREGVYTVTWWATALTENAHHRWRDAAEPLLQAGESIHTSALGGGYLVEISQTTRDEDEVVQLCSDVSKADRVRELLSAFPDAVGSLPEEPVPDYLIPPEPEEDESGTPVEEDEPEEFTA